MAQCISHNFYEYLVPAMPRKAFQQEPHNGGWDICTAIHLILNRNKWYLHEGWIAATAKELEGLLADDVWSYDKVVFRQELINRSKNAQKLINSEKHNYTKY